MIAMAPMMAIGSQRSAIGVGPKLRDPMLGVPVASGPREDQGGDGRRANDEHPPEVVSGGRIEPRQEHAERDLHREPHAVSDGKYQSRKAGNRMCT
jgi:hypothetical protein